jgi:predicted CoA-substrate-specific enzyme activase
LTSKAVVLRNGRIIGSDIIRSRVNPTESADRVMAGALEKAGLTLDDVVHCVGTGYGREKISFVNEAVSEIACHAKGASWLLPSVRTIIDIGGQDCKAIKVDSAGHVLDFTTNDKCASGTGRFLEVMAQVLNIGIEALGPLSARSKSPLTLTSTCTVWAQADIIKYLNSGHPVEDIGAGINTAMAKRIATLANSIKVERDICMTGGVAKNVGVVATLEKVIGHRLKKVRKADPQMAGAIGAAIISKEKTGGGKG